MLTLVDPNYIAPTSYAILSDPDFPGAGMARLLYDTVEALKGTGWFRGLSQYGINPPTWAGELEATEVEGCVHILLPRSPGPRPGFDAPGGWAAYHYTIGSYVYCWCPWLGDPDYWMVAATHELMEALTDANPGHGWVNQAGNDEGADECGGVIAFNNTRISTYWLNDKGRCIGQGDL